MRGDDAVDDRRGDQSLADRGALRPIGTGVEQIVDGGCQIVIRIHQAGIGSDDAVTIGIGVVAGGDVEVVA